MYLLCYSCIFVDVNKISSATTEGPCDALCQLKSCQLRHNCTKDPIRKGLQKVSDVGGHCRCSTYHFLLMLCSNSASVSPCFRDITTFTVHVTACDIEKSFSFDKAVEITIVCTFRLICKHIVNLCWISQRMGVRKVSNRKTNLQGHSMALANGNSAIQ